MEYTRDCPYTNRALNHLASCMNVFDFGSAEYELARKSFAYISNRIRISEKTDDENTI